MASPCLWFRDNAAMSAPITPAVCLRLPPIVVISERSAPKGSAPSTACLPWMRPHLPSLALSTPPPSCALLCSCPPPDYRLLCCMLCCARLTRAQPGATVMSSIGFGRAHGLSACCGFFLLGRLVSQRKGDSPPQPSVRTQLFSKTLFSGGIPPTYTCVKSWSFFFPTSSR
jgi:hypothetical protein